MTEDERTLLIAQSIIFAGNVIAEAIKQTIPYANREPTEGVLMHDAQVVSHQLAQNLDIGSGKPA